MKTETILKIGAVACVFLALLLAAGLWLSPVFGSPRLDSADLVLNTAIPAAGAANIVCAVVLDIRGYDTLGEATLLFAAVMGVVVLLAGRNGKDAPPAAVHPNVPAKIEPILSQFRSVEKAPEAKKPPWFNDMV